MIEGIRAVVLSTPPTTRPWTAYLVLVLNEPHPALCALVFAVLGEIDPWTVLGVSHGILVRCRRAPHEQMPHDAGLYDADLGDVVDLEDVARLIPRLAAPSQWLLDHAHGRETVWLGDDE